jgi:hypothetical protein
MGCYALIEREVVVMMPFDVAQNNHVNTHMVPKMEARQAETITRARSAMRPELRKAAEASWKHDREGLRYLAGR